MMFKKILKTLITWEGLWTIPLISMLAVFAAGMIQQMNPQVGIFPEQYLQEIIYKIAVLVIGSNLVQAGIFFNLILFFGFKISDIKVWWEFLPSSQKLWLLFCFYALYYLVYAMVRL